MQAMGMRSAPVAYVFMHTRVTEESPEKKQTRHFTCLFCKHYIVFAFALSTFYISKC